MAIYINDKTLNQPKNNFIINRKESLAKYTIKKRLVNYCSNISMKMIFTNMEKSSLTL